MSKSVTVKSKRKSIHGGELMKDPIVIDEKHGLVFQSEEELYDHFLPQIQSLEKEYFTSRADDDIAESDFEIYEDLLNQVLDDPDEIWEDATTIHGFKVRTYVGHYAAAIRPADASEPIDPMNEGEVETVYYIAMAYVTGEVASFIYLHFPSHDLSLVDRFRRGNLIYDRVIKEVEAGAVEGDALTEGDDLAVGLYRAMSSLRGEKDIPEEEFKKHEHLRENAIEEPDEIWRSVDLSGNVLVTFIKDFPDEGVADLHYIVVTIEDTASSSHALLFSFPTTDSGLLERYRHGENLQADEVVQEASH
jgi:hypothetical protein